MTGRGRIVALLLLSACAGEAPNEAKPEPGVTSVTMQSEDVVDGQRPLLTLTCGPNGASFWLRLIRVLDPLPADPHGAIKLDDGAPVRIGLVWLVGDTWAPAVQAGEETALVRAMLGARNVYFLGPEGTTQRPYRWDTRRLGGDIEVLRRSCL